MSAAALLETYLSSSAVKVSAVIDFNKNSDTLIELDLTANNAAITESLLSDTSKFSKWIEKQIQRKGARYGIGGYCEQRVIYKRSSHFNSDDEPRTFHLGTDIWAPEGSVIYSPLEATIHSFRYNRSFGDYGATIILEHQFESIKFFTLYGHLSLKSLKSLSKGAEVCSEQELGSLGSVSENGNWPSHLHFQVIFDMEGMEGDYPGVCKISEKDKYLENCPDPEIILRHTFN